MDLLERMKVATDTMTMGEKFSASIQVTVLGLIIVFASLAILYLAIVFMEKLINKPQETKEVIESKLSIDETVDLDYGKSAHDMEEGTEHSTELIAVITAAIAASLHISTQDVVIKGIRRVQDTTPIWAKMGRIEQINNML